MGALLTIDSAPAPHREKTTLISNGCLLFIVYYIALVIGYSQISQLRSAVLTEKNICLTGQIGVSLK
jgi:hypothetical protein